MSKKVLILSGSPRKNGNSDLLCNDFMKGAVEAGHSVEKIRVAEKNIGYCRARYACKSTGICAIKDDMADVLQKMIDADVLVLASPVYFYSIDAQLKAVIDRSVTHWLEVKDKELYYIMTARPLWKPRWPASVAMQTAWREPKRWEFLRNRCLRKGRGEKHQGDAGSL